MLPARIQWLNLHFRDESAFGASDDLPTLGDEGTCEPCSAADILEPYLTCGSEHFFSVYCQTDECKRWAISRKGIIN